MFTQQTGPDWRDVFAQDAMNAIIDGMTAETVATQANDIAMAAYTLADKMLEMRKLSFVEVE